MKQTTYAPSSAEAENEWNYISILLYTYVVYTRIALPLQSRRRTYCTYELV
jgi:hypothetical protein